MQQDEATRFVIDELGRHRSPHEVTRALTERAGCSWDEAQQFVNHIQFTRRTSIAARQSPLLIFLGVVTLISGLVMSGYYGAGIVYRLHAQMIPSYNQVAIVITGVAMVLGATIGLWQSIRAMLK